MVFILDKILVLILGFSIMLTTRYFIYNMLIDAGIVAENYRGEKIPVGIGIAYVMSYVISIVLANIYFDMDFGIVLAMTLGVLSMGFVGVMDDLIGDTKTKGFKGHIRSLLRGRLTTGGLKAISGFGIGFLVSIVLSRDIGDIVVNTFLIALFTNFINLFDLRPGRACKMFLFLGVLLLITSAVSAYNFMILVAIGVILSYIRYDLDARSMLGDVGSNAMGVTLGIFSAIASPFTLKLIFLVIIIIMHIIAEIYSFTKIIEKNSVLRKIDELGRK